MPRITRVSTDEFVLTDIDFTPDLKALLPALKDAAIEKAARDLQAHAQEVFQNEGAPGPPWEANAPATVAWKGHDVILQGRTDFLRDNIEIRKASDDTPQPAGKNQRLIGWFGKEHPDTGPVHRSWLPPVLNDATLAALHEFPPHDAKYPARPWLTIVAEHFGDDVLDAMAQELGKRIIGAANLFGAQAASTTPGALRGAAATQAGASAFHSVFPEEP